MVTEVPPEAGPEVGLTEVTVGVPATYVNWSFTDVAEVPPLVVTVTSATPGVTVAGEVAVICVAEFTTTPVAAVAPKATDAPVMKPVPVIVTDVPPLVGPVAGEIDVTDGVGATYVNWSATTMAEVPAVFVTRTFTTPGVTVAGELAVICVGESTVTPVPAVAPKATVEPVTNPVPVIVTDVPPTVEPDVGVIDVIAGVTALYVKRSPRTMADVPAVLVTRTSAMPVVTVAGDVAVIDVGEFTVTPVAAFAPKATVEPVMNPVPVIVTDVPPTVDPEVGVIDVTVGVTAV
jgi:hypothetical protein